MTRIEMKPAQLHVGDLGLSQRLDARAFGDGATLPAYRSGEEPGRFTWSSSAPGVVAVASDGTLTSVGWGVATIFATSDGVEGEARVVVRDAVRVDWTVDGLGETLAGVTLGPDGTIYTASSSRLRAGAPDGRTLWTLSLPGRTLTTPAVAADGTLYVGLLGGGAGTSSLPGGLAAVNPDGSQRWFVPEVGGIGASPAVTADRSVVVASDDGHVHAVDADGTVLWSYEGGPFYLSSPAVGADGVIYVGGSDRALHAIEPDGTGRWTYGTGEVIRSSPVIGADGTIYVGSANGVLHAVHADGTRRWRLDVLVSQNSAPALGPDGTIYVGGLGVSAVGSDGSVLWTYEPNGGPSSPLVGADGTVYASGVNQSVVTALDPEGRLLWNHQTGKRLIGSPAIGMDGAILATSVEGVLYSLTEIGVERGGYASSPWPKEHGNRANTGRTGG